MSSSNFSNLKLPCQPRKHNTPSPFTLFFYADKVTCYTNKATQSKTKKLPFSLVAIKICNSMFVRRQPSTLKLSLACVAGAGLRRGGGRGLGKEREWGMGSG